MYPVFIPEFGLVRYPTETLSEDDPYYEDIEERVRNFYRNLIRTFEFKERDYIDNMMTWSYTAQGHDFWSDASNGDYTWEEFMGTKAYSLLKYARDNMHSVEAWSPDRVKELL